MSENRQIRTDTLDFLDIKENLKDFLRGQNRFTDFDFDGSVLSTLLDVLAYNTHYNALYTNMAINESFLDSASKYSSVVSLAKSLGYTARSVRSARARLNIIVTAPGAPKVLTLERGTIFKSNVEDRVFDFIVDDDYTTTINNGIYTFNNVNVIEGTLIERMVEVTNTSIYVIPSENADITTLNVKIQDSPNSSHHTKFNYAANFINIGSESNTYFIKQREDLFYEIYFGDGNIGRAVLPGNTVHMSYIVSSGPAANFSRSFTYSSGIQFQFTDINVQTVLHAAGGDERESIESIRFNAPLSFSAQNRAVTSNDYVAVVKKLFPYIESVIVWGGQENIPKSYGNVFLALKPIDRDTLTSAEKLNIKSVLEKTSSIIGVNTVIVDPIFIRIELTTNVYYNSLKSRISVGQIENLIRNAVINYSSQLGKFGSEFRLSQLSRRIDSVDNFIISNNTTLRLRRTVTPNLNRSANYSVRFDNPIYQRQEGGTFYSTRFFYDVIAHRCYLRDNGGGIIQLFSEDINGVATYIKNVGSIDYSIGHIIINDMTIRGLFDPILEYVVIPNTNDIIPVRENIIQLPNNLLTVNILSDSITGNQPFIFNPMR